MASNEGGKLPITNFFGFGNKQLPKMVTPSSTMAMRQPDNLDGWSVSPPQETENEFAYVKAHAETRQQLINNARFAGHRNENFSSGSQVPEERRERGRGRGHTRGRGGDRGRGASRGGGASRGNRSSVGKSIFGTVPDNRTSDLDVYLKYDFDKRMFDTSQLVINRMREKIITHLSENQIMIIEGFTGCGKTTQVPQFILDDAVAHNEGCRIVVTQPRRIAAISVANRVGAERNWRVGGLVGYQVGMDKRVSDDTRLTYMTTGVLLQLLIARKSLNEWTHIIIDEVHERDLDTDLLLLVINKLMVDTRNDATKIILMSATLNRDKFASYFPLWDSQKDACACVSVDLPNQYPVTEYYLDDVASLAGYQNINMEGLEEPKVHPECYEIAEKIIEGLDMAEVKDLPGPGGSGNARGAVLVFLPGLLEIETFYKVLTEISSLRSASDDPMKQTQWQVLPLHSSITNEEQQRVFIPAKKGYRKIILATNIAESSITVPDIKYVIDFCLTKSLSCDRTTNYTCLRLEWASKNQCIQRRGRCGRVAAGLVYRMVTRKFYETLEQECQPEMLKSSLESVVLQVKLLDMGTPENVLSWAVDPPSSSLISRAVANLKEIGALTINAGGKYDVYDGDLTFVGRVLSRLPIDIRLGRLILLGHVFDCLEETVIIAAGLSVKTPFAYPYSKRLDAYLSKLNWTAQSFSDCMALLNLYTNWYHRHQSRDFLGFADEKAWARTYFVQLTSLREMKVLVDELYKRLTLCGIELLPSSRGGEDQSLILKLVIAGGFYPNYFNRARPNPKDYQKEIFKDVAGKDPFSSVVFQGFPLEQPGDLYKKTIVRHVAFQNSIPSIEFHGSKVVVTFDSRGDRLGPICSAVYRAVKLRQLRHTITFATPSRDEAYGMINSAKMKMDLAEVVSSPRQLLMPSLQVRSFQAIITHIESPMEFFIIRKVDEEAAREIVDTITKIRLSLKGITRDLCFPGQLCIVFVKGKFFRARIDSEKYNGDELMVYLIDRGMTMWIRRNYVYRADRNVCDVDLHLKPALAIKCRLSGIRAAVRNGCVWTTEAQRAFENYCAQSKNQVFIDIYSIVECTIAAQIKNTEQSVSVNDVLVEKKYADVAPEQMASKENNNIRERVYADSKNELSTAFSALEVQQNKCVIPQRLMDPPIIEKEPEQLAVLRGPHNPLEMVFTSLCRSAHMKQVITDGSSTNSVVLDQDPTNPSSRLLIAANVAIAARSGNILARETTVMPPIPGLCGLLSMLFCPKLEFRVDPDYTTYTGCLTGLGIDPENGQSVYRDHDMEVVFDTVIDNRDIALVNSVRSSMNYILTERARHTDIQNLRIRLRRESLSLLERQRSSMDEVWPEQPHEWNMLDPARLRYASKSKESGTVFPLHPHVALEEKQEGIDVPMNRNMYFCESNAQGVHHGPPIKVEPGTSSSSREQSTSRKRPRDSDEHSDDEGRPTIRIKTEPELYDHDEDFDEPKTPPVPRGFEEREVKQEVNDAGSNVDETIPQENERVRTNGAEPAAAQAESSSQQGSSPFSGHKSKTTPGTSKAKEATPIANFFSFGDKPQMQATLPNSVKAEIQVKSATLPQKAHYNSHTAEEETNYGGDDGKTKIKPIPLPMKKEGSDSDASDDESSRPTDDSNPRISRYFQRSNVYKKYPFDKRRVDPTRLAVYEKKSLILSQLEVARVIIVEGFTGCGKTTQVPQYILDKCKEDDRVCNIVVTQPRKIAAISVARRVCHEREWSLGSVVGYQVGMETKTDRNDTLLTFMTTGVLLQKLIGSKSLKEFTHIIIDEVHERDLESDLLLLIIKKIMAADRNGRESHVKLILMSATINTRQFEDYFLFGDENEQIRPRVVKIPFIPQHKVEELYLEDLLSHKTDLLETIRSNLDRNKAAIQEEIYDVAVNTIISLDNLERSKNPDPRLRGRNIYPTHRGAVLVFLPGIEEIRSLAKALDTAQKDSPDNADQDANFFKWTILTLHSSITSSDQDKVFQPSLPKYRKIILSTNIAESSVTVPDIAYVIDFCLTKSLCIDQATNYTTLRLMWASQSQCVQRRGRTGRVAEGKAYRLVGRSFYHALDMQIEPEMRRSNLETVILMCKRFDLDSPVGLLTDALDRPNLSGIERAISTLKELGALTVEMKDKSTGRLKYETCDGDLTFLGKIMSHLPIPQQCTRLIMLGHAFGVMNEAVIIAAALSGKTPFLSGFREQIDVYMRKMDHAQKSFSDLFALYHLYQHWICNFAESGDMSGRNKNFRERAWAQGARVHLQALRDIKSTSEVLWERLKRHNIKNSYVVSANADPMELTQEQGIFLKMAIAGAFYPNYFLRRRPDVKEFERTANRDLNGLDVHRTIFFKGWPQGLEGKFKDYEVQELQKWEGIRRSRRINVCPKQVTLPPVRINQVKVQVQHIVSPSQFWVVFNINSGQMQQIERSIHENQYAITLPRSKCVPNGFCLAPFENVYYRAKIIRVFNNGQSCLVYFVDYGNTNLVQTSCLNDFPPTLRTLGIHEMPCMAVEARLSQLKPNTIHGLHWSPEAVSRIKDFCSRAHQLEMKIYSINQSVVAGELFGSGPDGKGRCSLNELLQMKDKDVGGKQLGEPARETYLSEKNHERRVRGSFMDQEEENAVNYEQIGDPLDLDFIDPPRENLQMPVSLKGPWSPLEMTFQALVQSSNTKQVRIDNNSVNSVLLDHEPTAPTSRMLVAANVTITDKSQSITARDSTVMAPVPGILSLVSMIFAPKVELRVDPQLSRYTGVLCGCGVTPTNRDLPVHPDNDMEIVFDTEIDDDDIDLINKIRFQLNLILGSTGTVNIAACHKQLGLDLVKLMQKQRNKIDEEIWPQEEYVWNRIDPAYLNNKITHSMTFKPQDIFQPHSKVFLNKVVTEEIKWNLGY
ncbi:putative ATP-dependent RNA helicase TDRD9 [Orchesella cincta]|uniref:Probable ATP-dependent RNA helicase spindle-E n=1 Tax=Orchesella cincta TaxID=48709 RepID=A0A1D2NGF2_ORCCI|nr:putative ATP-dependent RNA helicase TDRD9 [Orchesella cincta]